MRVPDKVYDALKWICLIGFIQFMCLIKIIVVLIIIL